MKALKKAFKKAALNMEQFEPEYTDLETEYRDKIYNVKVRMFLSGVLWCANYLKNMGAKQRRDADLRLHKAYTDMLGQMVRAETWEKMN